MGVPDGAGIWAAAEAAHAALLTPEGEPALLDLLTTRLGAPGPSPQ